MLVKQNSLREMAKEHTYNLQQITDLQIGKWRMDAAPNKRNPFEISKQQSKYYVCNEAHS